MCRVTKNKISKLKSFRRIFRYKNHHNNHYRKIKNGREERPKSKELTQSPKLMTMNFSERAKMMEK